VAAKPIIWIGSSLDDLRNFPEEARSRAGYQLHRIQQGLMPSDWKPIPSLGSGVLEIRIHTGRQHRVFYIAKFEEAIYVLHAFEKKTQQTAKRDLAVARKRLAFVIRNRSQG